MYSNIRYLTYFSFLNCFRPHWPIAIIYFHDVTGSFASATAVHSVTFLMQALCELPAGSYSDRRGRRSTMIAGAVCASTSLFLYAVGYSFWILIAGALFEGLGRALFSGTDSALLFESIPPSDRDEKYKHYLGRIGSVYQLALCFSAVLAAVLSLYSLKLIVWIAVLPQIGSLWATLHLVDGAVNDKRKEGATFLISLRESLHMFRANKKLRLLAIADTLDFGFGEAVFYFQSAFFGSFVSPLVIGVTRCFNHMTGFLGFWFAGACIKWFGPMRTLILGKATGFLVKSAAVIFPSVATPFLMAGANVAYGPSSTARGDLLQAEFSDQQRATMGSLVSLTGSILFSIISFMLGVLADWIGLRIAMMFGLLGSLSVLELYRRIVNDNALQERSN